MSERMNVERIKEFKIMKALRYLLIVMSLVSVLSVKAQGTAQLSEVQMQSTSVMVGSGSALPQAAVTGTYMAGETPSSYSAAGHHGHIRRGLDEGDDEGTQKPGQPFPLGDAVWPLLALAAAFAFGKWIARTKPLR